MTSSLGWVSMASLQAAWDVKRAELAAEKEVAQKLRVRNVADPAISVQQIVKTVDAFMFHNKCSDLWRLISPPPSLPVCTWQSPVNAEWLVKLAPLAFEVFHFAQNTKLQGTRVRKALATLYAQRTLELPDRLGSKDDVVDKLDLTLRIGFQQFLVVKRNASLKSKIFRSLNQEEQFKMEMVLERIVLAEEDKQESFPTCDKTPLAICDQKDENAEIHEPKDEKAMEKKPYLRRSFQFSAKSLEEITKVPDIFNKILLRNKEPTLALVPASEEDLLMDAMAFVPQQLGSKAKKSEKKKKGKSAKAKEKAKSKKEKKAPKAKAKALAQGVHGSKKGAQVKSSGKKPGGNGRQPPSGGGVPTCPEYLILDKPTPEDGYRNLYVSRHWHRARNMARRFGLSKEEQKKKAGKAREQASLLWDEMHHG